MNNFLLGREGKDRHKEQRCTNEEAGGNSLRTRTKAKGERP